MTKSSTKAGGAKRGADRGDRSIEAYRRKRDPVRTTEPFTAERAPSSGRTTSGAFVVHLHDASRRHFDLRVQVGRVLKSFAVPRGPSLDPAEKRLAVNTEDHPLEYLDFEDVIPDGNYGAGPMIVWDAGRVQYLETNAEEGLEKGKLDFLLFGHKLRGRFALVQTGKRKGRAPAEENQWLLIKKQDAFSKTGGEVTEEDTRSVLSGLEVHELEHREELARRLAAKAAELGARAGDLETKSLVPMLCSIGEASRLSEKGRVYELKIDGVRIIADKRRDDVSLRYRTLRSATAVYPEIARAVRALPVDRLVLDGEIVAFDGAGRPSFQRLGRRIHAQRPHDVALAAAEVPVVYVVFDLLQLEDRDLTRLPLIERKRLLAEVVRGRGLVRVLDHFEDDGAALYEFCREQHLEGVVSKRADSAYYPGPKRTDHWLKIKAERMEDFVVVGWVTGKGDRQSLGSLELASYSGDKLVLRGRAGSGLGAKEIAELLPRLKAMEVEESVAEGELVPEAGRRHFTRPELVASIQFTGWTEDGHLWHPVFRGLRADLPPTECTAAPPSELLEATAAPEPEKPRGESLVTKFQVTNRNKVFWPEEGYTKGDLVEYYATIAEVMLPHLADRPVVLVRYPDGIEGKSFYQWNVPVGTPGWLRTLRIPDDEDHDEKNTFLVDDADGLAYLANLGCIPIHILASRRQSLGECDFLTIDFDIGERSFKDAVVLALSLKELLDDIGLVGFPKTSGHSGLHVLIPMGPGITFDVAKVLLELIGRLLQSRHQDISTMERRVSKRGPRVYIDTGQTGRARTIVAPYSVRAVPGATVSMPLTWDELHLSLDPRQFTMFTALERVSRRGDAYANFLDVTPDVPQAVLRLEERFKGSVR